MMKLGKFIFGLGVGAVAGLLFAPKKGSDLREDIKNMTKEDVEAILGQTIEAVKKSVDEFDVDNFRETTKVKLNELESKLESFSQKIKETDQFVQVKDSVIDIADKVNSKIDEVKSKVLDSQLMDTDFDELEEEIDDVENKLEEMIEEIQE